MRRLLSVAAIAMAALSLVWLVRLDRGAPKTTSGKSRPPSAEPSAGAAAAVIAGAPAPTATPTANPTATLGSIGGDLPDVLVDPKLLVEKSRRTLSVFSAGRPVKTYRIALGASPVGDKVREGDDRTPEGRFYVCVRNEESKYVRSLGLSYPDIEDAERGVATGLITKRQQRTIAEAIRHYRRPPYNTRLGGEIMIHGGGTGQDWTTGCIALTDFDIAELYPVVGLGTPVEIRP